MPTRPSFNPLVPVCLALAATVLATAHVRAAAMPRVPPLHGSLVLKSMPVSPIVHRKVTTWVYLPDGYGAAPNAGVRYPVVYLLHGEPGGWTDCFRAGHIEEMADKLIAAGEMKPAILVAFDGNGPNGARDMTEFCNRIDGYRAEDFIVDELVPYIDATYRTIADPAHRALWGYSSGGYGALNLGLKHPDVWHVLASHAGFYQPGGDLETMTKVLGPKADNPGLWAENSPLETVKGLPPAAPLHIYIEDSPKDEDYAGFINLTGLLKARNIDCVAVTLNKAHSWRIISTDCRDSLLFIDRNWPPGG